MDGNSSPRGRHRHRADPRDAAATDGSPQWSSSASGPEGTPAGPEWTPDGATSASSEESWFDKPAGGAAGRPAWSAEPWRANPTPPWASHADEPPTQSWSLPATPPGPAAEPSPGPGRSAADEPGRSWRSAADEPPAGQSWRPAADEPPTQSWSPAFDQPAGPWSPAPDQSGARSWPAGGDHRVPPARSGEPDPWRPQAEQDPAHSWPAADRPGPATWSADQPAPPAWAGSAAAGGDGARNGGPAAGADGAWGGGPQPVAAGTQRRGVKHPVRLALYALVIVGLVAGSIAWLTVDKNVRLTVDGEARTVSTYASTVSGVLDDAGVTFSPRDILAPTAETKVSDGAEIVLRRGRLLRLTIDGKPREVWVHATTVQEALDQVGFRQNGLFVSATRSERLPLEGYDLTVRTPKTVTVQADGRRQRVVTTAATVGQALDEAGVSVDGDDKVSQLATAAVVTGMTVTVTRVSRKTTTVRTELKYDTVEKKDPDADVGSRKVTTKGVPGLQQVTYVEMYVDGKLTSKKVAKVTVLTQPVDEVVMVGPEPPPTQPAGCEDFPTTGGLNWCGLARCESGLNPNAYNPAGPYYGLYQFDQGTWQSNGGSGTPSGKSIAEQTRVAYNLYQARGRSPWPSCGRNL